MTTRSEEFILVDHEGEEHEYRVDVHPSREGSKLMLALAATATEPVLQTIRMYASEAEDGKAPQGLGDIVKHPKFSELGVALRSALLELDPEMLELLFRYTYRDGKRLASVAEYDRAYAGNWGEWTKALWKIVQVNGFAGFLSTMLGS